MRKYLASLCLVLPFLIQAQSTYAPLNQDYYHRIDREEIVRRGLNPVLHTSFKPYKREDIVTFLDTLDSDSDNMTYLQIDNWEYTDQTLAQSKKLFLGILYQTKPDFFFVKKKDFLIKVSPVLYLSLGKDNLLSSKTFINTRGIEVRGEMDKKLGFYAYVGENQALFPKYVQNYTSQYGAVPNEAFWKKFGENGGVDFFTARGYFTFKATKHIDMQFGYDKNFIGNGYRSLVLSDYSAPSTFLKIQTKIWRIQYTNLYTELVADAPSTSFGSNGTKAFPKKFMAAHHLSINVTKRLNIGLFESIIFHRGDSTSNNLEWNYFNPIMFYRSIEQYTGSPDNALFGMDFKWNLIPSVQVYGQALLDELVVGELKANNGWWGNKFALQGGLKYVNAFGVNRLDLQTEYNLARPFTYSHESIFTNYAHYRQALAHPLGANFKELIFIARYQPVKNLFFTSKVINTQYGTDASGQNNGGNILKDYNTREGEYGNTIGQGIKNDVLFVDLTATYMLRHNLFIDLKKIYRKQKSDDPTLTSTTNFSSVAIRLNIAARDYTF